MKATYQRQHTSSKTNVPVFVYSVEGTELELARLREVQGANHRTDKETNKDLWFTTRYAGDEAKLIITQNNKVIADMSEFKKLDSLSKQFGGNLGEQIARQAAAMLFKANSSEAQPKSVPTPNAEGLNDL
jgi:hypothetical protein